MKSIKIRQRVGRDGILRLEIPTEIADRDLEIAITYQPAAPETSPEIPLADLYGICADDPLEIDDGGIRETLDEDLTGAFD
ncbi:MAG: hypothetical protein ACFB9N_06165 [Geitlerinemataceae cyanobacterium]